VTAEIEFAPDGPPVRRVQARRLSDVTPRRVRWLIRPLIPLRTLTLVAGEGGLGKSMFLALQTARLTRGELDDVDAADVLVISSEDTAEEVIAPRLIAVQADLERVHQLYVATDDGGAVVLPDDLVELGRLARETGARLVWIDPIAAALPDRIDSHKDADVRRVLGRLQRLAEEEDLAIAMVGHLNKSPTNDAYIRVGGSVAFYNQARSVLTVTAEAGSDDARLVAQHKMNLARRSPVLRYRVEPIVLPDVLDPDDGQPIETARLIEDGTSELHSRDVLGYHEHRETKHEAAEALLDEIVADGQEHERAGVIARLSAHGINERTALRAANALGVEMERKGYQGGSHWRLPHSRQLSSPSDVVDDRDGVIEPFTPNRDSVGTKGGVANDEDEIERIAAIAREYGS
jgi:RecA-family ATPase